jgi:putative OPT family oligopeptide transporter
VSLRPGKEKPEATGRQVQKVLPDSKRPKREGLSPDAYEPIDGDKYQPYVAPGESIAEFTIKAALSGIVFGVIFGSANAYLGLRAGLTVSTSIPIAVITVAFFRAMRGVWGRSTILEHNTSQTIGSASSSLTSGLIFTIPALFLWGLDPKLAQIAALAAFGGVLGILAMIPLRAYLMSREHGKLPYPEGTACAEVLVAAESGGARATGILKGLGIGFVIRFFAELASVWEPYVRWNLPRPNKAQLGIETAPMLMGVGFILNYRIASIMVAGSLLSWGCLIPLIAYMGEWLTEPLFPEAAKTISEMTPKEMWNKYIRYVGAGGVALGGILTIIRAFPTMVGSFRLAVRHMGTGAEGAGREVLRTRRDTPLKLVLLGVVVIVLMIAAVPHVLSSVESPAMRIIAAMCVAVFAFFFVTVSSRIVGIVGVSSNPTSGMTIATLLGTSLIFLALGWTDTVGMAAALTVGTVVCVASSIAGDTSQDLKTGFLVGATPFKQQTGELLGALTSAIAVAATVILLCNTYEVGSEDLAAPQATLMKTVIEGVLTQSVPWELVLTGAGIAAIMELLGIPALPFAVGMYLPLTTMSPIFVGGVIRRLVERGAKGGKAKLEKRREGGILFSSGLIAGEGLMGVVIAGYTFAVNKWKWEEWEGWGHEWSGPFDPLVALGVFACVGYLVWRSAVKNR